MVSSSRSVVDLSEDIEDDVGTEEIDIVVSHIKRLARTANLEFALRVGGVIIHHFYAGDTEAWRSRGPKTSSFRRLAQHPGVPLSPGALYRCVALFELCDRLNAPSRWEHLGASHLRAVLGLPPATQEKLLALANAKRWTVKILQQEILSEKALRVTCGGRRAEAPLAKTLKSLRKCLESHRDATAQVDCLSSSDLETSLLLVDEARACLEHLSSSLRAALTETSCPRATSNVPWLKDVSAASNDGGDRSPTPRRSRGL